MLCELVRLPPCLTSSADHVPWPSRLWPPRALLILPAGWPASFCRQTQLVPAPGPQNFFPHWASAWTRGVSTSQAFSSLVPAFLSFLSLTLPEIGQFLCFFAYFFLHRHKNKVNFSWGRGEGGRHFVLFSPLFPAPNKNSTTPTPPPPKIHAQEVAPVCT